MKQLSEYKSKDYTGIDASIETSLFEYGLIWGKNEYCTRDNEYQFVYGINSEFNAEYGQNEYCTFDHGYITKNDFIGMLDSWANDESFYSCQDITRDELIERFPYSVYDLFSYYGYENVFGSSYWEGFKILE